MTIVNSKALILSCAFFLAGCISLTSNDSLYKSYNKFKANSNAETIINKAPLYFSERLLSEHYKDDPDAPDQLLFYKVMGIDIIQLHLSLHMLKVIMILK